MATFKYSAFDANEKNTTGFINATDLEEAKQMLQDRGLTPLKINTSSQKKSKLKISTNNLSIFTKQMSALLSAGTPIEKCLLLLSKQSSNNKFSQILSVQNPKKVRFLKGTIFESYNLIFNFHKVKSFLPH